jgi:hypothetical protein
MHSQNTLREHLSKGQQSRGEEMNKMVKAVQLSYYHLSQCFKRSVQKNLNHPSIKISQSSKDIRKLSIKESTVLTLFWRERRGR